MPLMFAYDINRFSQDVAHLEVGETADLTLTSSNSISHIAMTFCARFPPSCCSKSSDKLNTRKAHTIMVKT